MSKRQWSSEFSVGIYRCELTYIEGQEFKAAWDPVPLSLSPELLQEYRNGRNNLIQKIAHEIGGPVMVIE